MRFRNQCEAFNGSFSCSGGDDGKIEMRWDNEGISAVLRADFRTKQYQILTSDPSVSFH